MVCEERDIFQSYSLKSECNITGWGVLYDDDKITYKDEDGKDVDNVIWTFNVQTNLYWPCICCMSGRFRYSS